MSLTVYTVVIGDGLGDSHEYTFIGIKTYTRPGSPLRLEVGIILE